MDTTPEVSKRTRAKPKAAAAKATASAKKPRSSRKPAVKETPAVGAMMPAPVVELQDLGSMIATAAYYLAAERNFAPGHELEDWLEAERRVRAAPLG